MPWTSTGDSFLFVPGGFNQNSSRSLAGSTDSRPSQIVTPTFPKFDTLTEDFAAADTAKWTFSGVYSVTGGQLVLDAGSFIGAGARTSGLYDLTDTAVSVELVQRTGVGGGTAETYIHALLDGANRISFHIIGATISWEENSTANGLVSGSETYSPTNHRFLRLGRSGNNWTWERSSDGASWTSMNTRAASFTGAGLQLVLATQNSVSETVDPAILDNVNLIPPTAISLSDTASGADALTVAAAVPLADTGAGADAVTVSAAVPLPDTGAGADALTVAAAVALSDTGAAADALTVTRPVALSDTGNASDALTVAVAVPLTDSGAGTDTLGVAAAVSLADPRNVTDAIAVSAAVSLADTGTGTDAGPTVATQVPLTDTVSGADNLSTPGGPTPKDVADTGTGADALAVAAAVGLSDTAVGADLLAVAAAFSLADTATAADALTVTVSVALTDTATGADAVTAPGATVGEAAPEHTLIVHADRRLQLVGASSRTMTAAPNASRTVIVTADPRTDHVPAADRLITV